jgi:hypothetical protein
MEYVITEEQAIELEQTNLNDLEVELFYLVHLGEFAA